MTSVLFNSLKKNSPVSKTGRKKFAWPTYCALKRRVVVKIAQTLFDTLRALGGMCQRCCDWLR